MQLEKKLDLENERWASSLKADISRFDEDECLNYIKKFEYCWYNKTMEMDTSIQFLHLKLG